MAGCYGLANVSKNTYDGGNVYSKTDPPVFFAHYWLEDSYLVIRAENVICPDYSVAKNGSLVAYRWDEEKTIDNKHFVWV
jgi:hypothetical protein